MSLMILAMHSSQGFRIFSGETELEIGSWYCSLPGGISLLHFGHFKALWTPHVAPLCQRPFLRRGLRASWRCCAAQESASACYSYWFPLG